ncbi:MAG TPA: nucleoside phosphorylase [Candidatus Aphodovivens avistercoris]|nr:nucleoside phosphorylase [Candidatus Aphodovivens avistercoris]
MYPLFEHDYSEPRNPMSRECFGNAGEAFPERCLVSFMGDVLKRHAKTNPCRQIAVHKSEAFGSPIWKQRIKGVEIAFVQAPVGAPAAGILVDLLIASGVKTIVSCGGCGVLNPILSGIIIIPSDALRDEGTSCHYLAPKREIALDAHMVEAAKRTAIKRHAPFLAGKVWTSDGFFRETPSIVKRRKEEGCCAVDMECSALAAIARFYGASYGAVLYSGDSLSSPESHDQRDWVNNKSAREEAFYLSLDVLLST